MFSTSRLSLFSTGASSSARSLRARPHPSAEGAAIVPAKPPIVVVDPRAGHGPGIGGMKPDSEIGVATRAGHPCYTEATFLNVKHRPF